MANGGSFRRAAVCVIGLAGRGRAFAGDTGNLILAQVLTRGMLNLLTLFAANILTVRQFSTFNYFIITSGLLATYVTAGLPLVATRVMAARSAKPEPRHEQELSAVLILFVAINVLVLLAAPAYLPLFDADETDVTPFSLLFGSAVLAAAALASGGMQGIRAFRASLPPIALGAAMMAASAVLAWLGLAEQALIWGYISASLLPAVVFTIYLCKRRLLPSTAAFRNFSWPAFGRVLGQALPNLGLGAVFTTVSWLIARRLLDHQVGANEFGTFAAGLQWYALALLIPSAAGQALFPRIVVAAAKGSLSLRTIVTPALAALVALLLLAPIASLFAPLLSRLYGANYLIGSEFVLLIVVAAALSAPVTLTGMAVTAWKGSHWWLVANLALLGAGVGLATFRPPSTALEAVLIIIYCQCIMLVASALVVTVAWHVSGRARSRVE